MALNSTGPISFGGSTVGQSINLELGVSATAEASINSTSFRTLAGVASGQISVSNFYGKSNSVGWFATIGVSTAETPTYGLGINSSGTVFVRINTNLANSDQAVIQFSTTGAITYQRNKFTDSFQGFRNSLTVDSSGNYYVIGYQSGSKYPQVTKFNSSNVQQWSRYWTENDFTGVNQMSKPFVDASGNVYFGMRSSNSSCCGTDYYYQARRLNSSGVLSTQTVGYSPGSPNYSSTAGVCADSSGNVYSICGGYGGGLGTVAIAKANSSFVFQTSTNYYGQSPSGSFEPQSATFDATNNVGYVVGRLQSTSWVMKFNSSCQNVWSYQFSDTGNWYDCALDSSGNIYAASCFTVAGSGIRALKIIKLDTNGSLQWARYLRCTTLNMNTTGISIAISGTRLAVCGQLSGGTAAQNRGFVLQVPTDGSGGAGSGTTFTNDGRTWTYASYTETQSSVTPQNATGMTQFPASTSGSTTTTITQATPTATAVTTTV